MNQGKLTLIMESADVNGFIFTIESFNMERVHGLFQYLPEYLSPSCALYLYSILSHDLAC